MSGLKSASLARDFGTLFRAGTLAGVGDGRLLERYINDRDEAAFEELLARHGPMVLGICRGWLDDPRDIEDAFQATFLLLVRKAGSLHDRHALSSWLYGVAVRVARRARANSIRRRVRERPMLDEPTRPAPAPHVATDEEVLAIVDEEIRRLPDRQQIAVILCLLEGQTHEAAARQLGWRLGTVKSRISAARKTLTRRLTRRGLTPTSVATVLPTGLNRAEFRTPLSPDLVRTTLEAARETVAKPWITAVGAGAASELVGEVARIMIVARIRAAAMVALAMIPLAWAAPGFLRERPVEQVAQAEEKKSVAAPALAAPKPRVDHYGDPLPPKAAMRLGTIRHRQTQSIEHVVYTPDGRTVVTDNYRRLQFWDAHDGRKLREIAPQLDHVYDFAVSLDGKTIAVAGYQYDPTGRYVYRLRLIDIASGLFGRGGEWTQRGEIRKIGYTPDGKVVAVVSDDGTLRLWDAATSVLLKTESVGVSRVWDVSFSRDSANPVMAIGSDHDISLCEILEPKNHRTIATQNRYSGAALATISADGTTLAGTLPGDDHGEVQLWRVSDGAPLSRLKLRKNEGATRISFSPDGKILALNGNNHKFEAFEVSTGKTPTTLSGIELAFGPISFAPDGKTIAVVGDGRTLHLWDTATGEGRLATPDAHEGDIRAIEFHPDGKTLISGSDDMSARIWDLETGMPKETLPHNSWVRSISISADGSRLATASEYPGTVNIWDMSTGERLHTWDAEAGNPTPYVVRGILLDKQGSKVIAGIGDGRVRRWDVATGKELPIARPKLKTSDPKDHAPVEPFYVARAIFSRDGRLGALISMAKRMKFFDLASGEVRFEDTADSYACAIAPNGRSLAVGKRGKPKQIPLADGRMRIDRSKVTGMIAWLDSQTGRALREIEIPESTVNTLTFSPDGKSIAAGISPNGKNGIVRVYRLRDMRELHEFEVPCHSVRSFAFTSDGKRLAAGLEDTSILIWDLNGND